MRDTGQDELTQACELASALADGELRGAELVRALEALRDSEGARARWHAYHLVGDVLRQGPAAAVAPHDGAFAVRVRERLRAEPTRPPMTVPTKGMKASPAANDSAWRWKLAAGLSSVAVVALFGWQIVQQRPDGGSAAQLAQHAVQPLSVARSTPSASGNGGVMLRDPRLDRLIAEHQQFGGTSALQMPAGFLRNATFERPAR